MAIDLRSDTVTQPCASMRTYMSQAPVGDDAYGEDESVNLLQNYCKELFQKEDALFVTSGMMANRLAFLSQTSPGDEVITAYHYHVNFFDSAPMAAFAGVVMNTRHPPDGILRPEEVKRAIHSKQRYDYFAQPKLISVENTINGCAGKIFPFEILQSLYDFSREEKIALHLDGARLFNAHIATGIPLHEFAKYTDTLSVCFAKGLGAPYGSMLMGTQETIAKARKFRLWLGGGVHQSGMQAAAAYFALTHNLERIVEDHIHAQQFAEKLKELEIVVSPVETNMVQFSVKYSAQHFLDYCTENGLLLFPWVPDVYRAVFHKGISSSDVIHAAQIIQDVLTKETLLA